MIVQALALSKRPRPNSRLVTACAAALRAFFSAAQPGRWIAQTGTVPMSKLEKVQRRLLTEEEVRFLGQRFRQLMGEPLVGMLDRYGISPEDQFRFNPLAVRLATARSERGLDLKAAAAALKVARYRLADIEGGRTKNLDSELLVRYVEYLGLKNWFGRWKKANASLAKRLQLAGEGNLITASRATRRKRREQEAER